MLTFTITASAAMLLAAWLTPAALSQEKEQKDPLPQLLLTTSQGDVVIELFEDEAPNTVANFITLAERGFYDGLTFHRVLKDFVAQGGDPRGDGSGGPGYRIACECDRPDHHKHERGVISMAHAGKDTGGSQFFLTLAKLPHLDGKHTVFGRIIKGMDVVDKLQKTGPGVQPDKIVTAKVLRKRDHSYRVTEIR